MCGIIGFISREKNKKHMLKMMTDRIAHRGPDGEGFYIDEDIALGHRRLSIIDINSGSQPMTNEDDNLVLIYNGEIYNYIELKSELIAAHHTFKTNSDSEVLIHGYEEWKENLPKHLRGMFSFAIWNKKEKTLFLARDHFGIKPLYYYHDKEHFAFASELKAFLAYEHLEKEFNESLLEQYLAFGFSPSEETFIRGIKKLSPGCTMTIKEHEISIERYFDLNFTTRKETMDEAVERIKDVLADSINSHLISDVEVGSFLSSGIDSSLIVSLAKPEKTYTIGYYDYEKDETSGAKDLACKLGLENKVITLNKEDYISSIDDVFYYQDEPSGDPSIIALYHVAKLASKDIKVILSGEGSDEFFAGYNSYLDELQIPIYNRLPFKIRRIISKIFKQTPEFKGRNFLVRRGMYLEEYYTGINRYLSDKEIEKVLKKTDISHIYSTSKSILKKHRDKDELVQKQIVDISCWLVGDILHKADRMGMANSLETRVPFTDVEVFKVSSSLTKDKKITKNQTKVALRKLGSKVIPTAAYKKRKLGFPVPVCDWLRESDFYELVKDTFLHSQGNIYFNVDNILNLLEEHKMNKKDNYKKIWTIYAFLKWYDIFMV